MSLSRKANTWDIWHSIHTENVEHWWNHQGNFIFMATSVKMCVHRAHWQYLRDASWMPWDLRRSDRKQLDVQHWEYLLLQCQQNGWAAHPAAFPLLSGLLQHLLSWSPPSTTRYKSTSLAAVTAGMLAFKVRAAWLTWQLALPLANNCIKTQYNGHISIGDDNQEYAGGLFTVQSITTELCPLHHLTKSPHSKEWEENSATTHL